MHFLVPENTAAKKIYLRNAVMVVIIRGMRGPKKGGVGEGGGVGRVLPSSTFPRIIQSSLIHIVKLPNIPRTPFLPEKEIMDWRMVEWVQNYDDNFFSRRLTCLKIPSTCVYILCFTCKSLYLQCTSTK